MACEDCKAERDIKNESAKTLALLNESVKQRDFLIRVQWAVMGVLLVAVMVMACCMTWAVRNAQDVANEAILNALETYAEIGVSYETTTTTEVTQDTGEGDGNNVYLDGDNTTYNEAGGGE